MARKVKLTPRALGARESGVTVGVTPQSSVAPTFGSQPGMVCGLVPRATLAGQLVNVGGRSTLQEMAWMQLRELPHSSYAV